MADVLRILFVIDARICTHKDPANFGLGNVLETLRDDTFAWWARFHVQVVRRDYGERVLPSVYPDTNYTVGNAPGFEINGFRFTEDNFSFNDWDQVGSSATIRRTIRAISTTTRSIPLIL